MNTQGERVKKVRQALGLSQDEFGSILGIKKQFVSRIENDKDVFLNNDKLVTLLLNSNVNINYILGGIGEMFIKQQPANLKDEIKQAVREMLKDGELKDEFK